MYLTYNNKSTNFWKNTAPGNLFLYYFLYFRKILIYQMSNSSSGCLCYAIFKTVTILIWIVPVCNRYII